MISGINMKIPFNLMGSIQLGEWGYNLSQNNDVCFLLEEAFAKVRVKRSGLLYK